MKTSTRTLPSAPVRAGAPIARGCGARRPAPFASRRPGQARPARGSVAARAERQARWEVVWEYLVVQRGFESTGVQEAREMADSGEYVFVDVRPAQRFEEGRIPGALSVPLYQKVDWSNLSFAKVLRAAALAVNGVEPVEPNPKFLEQLVAAAGGKGIILYDEIGGTLQPTSTFGQGKVSRSLLATYQAIQSGKFEKVAHLRGGIYTWFRQQLPIDGSYDGSYAGRTPSVVEEKEFSYGRPPTLLDTEENAGSRQ